MLYLRLLIIILTFALISHSHAQNQDEIAINKVVTDFEKIYNKKDAKTTANLWAEGGNYINYLGTPLHGKQEIEKYFQTIFTQFYQTAQNKLFEPTIRFLNAGIEAVDAK